MTIKFILIGCLLFLAWLMFRGPGTTTQVAWRRIAVSLVAAAGVVTVIFPDSLTWLGKLVGVGRGTDLLLYGYVVFSLFLLIGLYQRITRLESRLAQVVREIALTSAPMSSLAHHDDVSSTDAPTP
ncbi:DUF2304 domain-containing protein [Nocardioides sp.]|uniref:DUF2304 domain-containing protein n=1 Tax=Nocardioides sp. TaxID=35761 RepID=UPI00286B9C81|nr:DUF2304 domain-containing protein [Nocardioides sp.]